MVVKIELAFGHQTCRAAGKSSNYTWGGFRQAMVDETRG